MNIEFAEVPPSTTVPLVDNLYAKACVEVVELLKYLGDSKGIPFNKTKLQEFIKDRDPNYNFKINENIPIMENEFLGMTFELLNQLLEPED